MNTQDEIISIVEQTTGQNSKVTNRFLERIKDGSITRDENDQSHFCAYFLPFNPATKEVFLGDHKKSGLWLAPGGHLDQGEDLFTVLNREAEEELGVKNAFASLPKPFLLSITPIDNPPQTCREHLDLWFLFETDGNDFKVDDKEFKETKWVSLDEALKLLEDPANIEAIQTIQKSTI